MYDHLRDTVEDVAVGIVVTAQWFQNIDKGWITTILGGVYICYKIYTQHLKAKTEKARQEKESLEKEMINKQLEGWEQTRKKVEDDLIKRARS